MADAPDKPSKTRGLRPFKQGHDPRRNAGGRPSGARGLAAWAKRQTRGGKEMLEILFEIARDPTAKQEVRKAAAEAALTRTVGPPSQEIVLDATVEAQASQPARLRIDYSKLTVDEMEALRALVLKAREPDADTVLIPAHREPVEDAELVPADDADTE